MRGLAGRLGKREGDDPLSHLGSERGDARRARLVATKAFDALGREALLPTAVLLLPVRRMIAAVPRPSAVASTIAARQTCF
jgi:hypothetical protein